MAKWSGSQMLSVPERAELLQEDSWLTRQTRGTERKIRPAPLNIYDLSLHTFLPTFFVVFCMCVCGRRGVMCGDPHTLRRVFTKTRLVSGGGEGKQYHGEITHIHDQNGKL